MNLAELGENLGPVATSMILVGSGYVSVARSAVSVEPMRDANVV